LTARAEVLLADSSKVEISPPEKNNFQFRQLNSFLFLL